MSAPLYEQLGLPVFQNKVYPSAEAARRAVTGDVRLVQSEATGLVHNAAFDASRLDYDADYQNEQACSPAFMDHLREVLRIMRLHLAADRPGIEVGCGKGFFLRMLVEAGFDVTGYDPAYEGDDPRVVKAYFGEGAIERQPAYVVLRHVLEHIDQPWSFLERLAARCDAGTRIYIEVPCFDWIVEHNAFYDVFYEHVNYFTLDVLRSAFGTVDESGRLFGGQYLYLIADLSTFGVPSGAAARRHQPLGIRAHLERLLEQARGPVERALVWGAGAKGITFANVVAADGKALRALIDINPAKQGRFAGLSALPIVSPASAEPWLQGADVFVMNPVYLDEIKTMAGSCQANWIAVA